MPEETQLTHRVISPDPTITQVAHWFKGELLNEGLGGNLFADSLKNLLTVHLLRNYCESGTSQKKRVVPGRALDAVKLNVPLRSGKQPDSVPAERMRAVQPSSVRIQR
ncbi:MAG: hypothetical protein VKK04_15500 [Synechococcales bacterium]|nr:hypothetical protein [Synechococcales bacterium]